MATSFHGIAIYEILDNGNVINGVYTNIGLLTRKRYHIDTEIARKKTYDDKGVEGTYECIYIEANNTLAIKCELEILKISGVYEFKWKSGSNVDFQGIGMKVGNSHIAVSYIEP